MRIDPRLPLLVAGLAGLIVGNVPWWTAAWTSEFAGSEVSIGALPGTGGLSGALPGVVLVAVLLTLTLAVRGRLPLIPICRSRRSTLCISRWSPNL